jgi:lipoprotein NlpI
MVMPWSGKDDGALRVVLHEFTHFASTRNLSVLPAWVSEGIAEFYSTFHIDEARGVAVVGEPPRDRLPWLYLIPLMPLDVLTAAPSASKVDAMPEGEAAALQAAIYARIGARREAEVAYARAQAQPPSDLKARIALDRVRVGLSITADAAARYDQLVAMTREAAGEAPLDAPTQFHLALAALLAGREDESDAALAEADRLLPSAEIYRRRAYMAFALGRDAVTARDVRAFFKAPAWWRSEQAAYVSFLGALALRRLRQPEAEARGLLDQAAPRVDAGTWTARLMDYMKGSIPAAAILDAADDNDERTEARTYVGFDDALGGRRESAIAHFRWVRDKGSRNFVEYPLAVAELERLEKAR